MSTLIGTAGNLAIPPIVVPDGMPEDELLDAMQGHAVEVDRMMGELFSRDLVFKVRAWPNGRFRADEVVEIEHKRQRYSPELVAELIAEDYR